MAGAGYKLFNTGDVLTAAQVNTYLQEQTVMRFANATARTTALSGVLAEGMMSYLDDTNSVEVYNGSAWISVGSTGDITAVTAGTGLSGGGTSGDVTLSLSIPVTEVRGGTNQTTYTTGDILYASASNTLTKRAIGTTGQVLTVSGGLPTWATPSGGFPTHVGCLTFKSGSQSLSNANQTYISFDQEVYDTNSIHDNSTNNGRLTVPSGNGGYWFIYALGSYDTSTGGGNRMNSFIVNRTTEFGTYAVLNPANAAQRQEVLSFAVRNLSAGDYVELLCAQYSGGTINLNGGNENSSRFGMYRLS
jgi:hypothetical protein